MRGMGRDLNSLRTRSCRWRFEICVRESPRKRHGVSLLGSAANTHCMHVGLGQPAEAPTQTIERVEKALATLQNIERFACDHHDHVSFAKAVDVDEPRSRACLGL